MTISQVYNIFTYTDTAEMAGYGSMEVAAQVQNTMAMGIAGRAYL
jgi:uncharacterized protein YaaW (UPF0174 family)